MDTSFVLRELLALCVTTLMVTYYTLESLVLMLIPSSWKSKKDITSHIALVTGAGHGLGRELALRLSRRGATVVVWDINGKANEETKNLIVAEGGVAHAYQCDVSNYEQVNTVAQATTRDVGNVAILVNNAGIVGSCDRIINTPPDSIEKTFSVNVFSQFWTVKAFLPHMLETNSGHIVNVGSVLGFTGQDKLAPYCSTKHAVHGFHESLTWELRALKKLGIKTTLIAPFAFNSGMFTGVNPKFAFLTPVMTTESVADRTMDALLHNEDVAVIPRTSLMFYAAKTIFPWKATAQAYEFFGATTNTANLKVIRTAEKNA